MTRAETLRTLKAERDRAMKACEMIAKRFTPRPLRFAPKDRIIIGVERPPFEDDTFFYDLIWSERLGEFVTPFVEARNGATHFLDPRDLIGLPPAERMSREDRKTAEAEFRNPAAAILRALAAEQGEGRDDG